MPNLTDILELKAELGIDPANTSENLKLGFLIEDASRWIEEALGRSGNFFYGLKTQYYSGTGTQKLNLRSRPVYLNPDPPVVYVDQFGYWGQTPTSFNSAALEYGQDYVLLIDQDDGVSSRCGTLVRINQFWQKRGMRQTGLLSPFIGDPLGNIKVTYTAGYSMDNLPREFRLATNFLVARFRQILPLGYQLTSESYEERSVSYYIPHKSNLMSMVWPMIWTYKNWKW